MRFALLLLTYLLTRLLPATAQTTVSGRVVDARSTPLPGVTILQRSTTNGISSDADGQFTLTVPEQPDSVELVVSSVGYLTRQLRVAAGTTNLIRLAEDTKVISCFLTVASPKVDIGLVSGLRYAPFGARLQLYGNHLLHLPFTVATAYQTNLRRNHAGSASLLLPTINRRTFSLRPRLDYQNLRAAAARLRFASYAATLGVDYAPGAGYDLPKLLLTAGFARLQPLPAAEPTPARSGMGYGVGVQHSFLPYPFHLQARALATRWPGGWQWQGEINHTVRQYTVGVAFNRLRQYQEVGLALSRSFY